MPLRRIWPGAGPGSLSARLCTRSRDVGTSCNRSWVIVRSSLSVQFGIIPIQPHPKFPLHTARSPQRSSSHHVQIRKSLFLSWLFFHTCISPYQQSTLTLTAHVMFSSPTSTTSAPSRVSRETPSVPNASSRTSCAGVSTRASCQQRNPTKPPPRQRVRKPH